MSNIEKLQEECTHNCMTCGAGCGEHEAGDKVGLIDKTLNAISDINAEDLLGALDAFNKEME